MPVEHNVLAEDKTGGLTSIFSLLSYRAFNWLVGVLVVYVIVRGIVAASQKPFFFDEIITLAIASQANVRNIWNSLVQSVDSLPPLFYLVERLSLAIFHNPTDCSENALYSGVSVHRGLCFCLSESTLQRSCQFFVYCASPTDELV